MLIRKASASDATFFVTEIAAPARCGSTDDDVIHQMKLQDSAGFENSPGKPQIGFRRDGSPEG